MNRMRRAIDAMLGRTAGIAAAKLPEGAMDIELVLEAFERTAVGLTLISLDGTFLRVNRTFCEMTGYGKEDLVGQSFRRITHPDDLARDEEQLASVAAGATGLETLEKRYRRRDGSVIWVRRNASVLCDAQGAPRFVIAAMLDLTAQRAKDRALTQSNGFLSAIIEHSPIAIYATDLEGLITLWNPAAERTFGFARGQVGQKQGVRG